MKRKVITLLILSLLLLTACTPKKECVLNISAPDIGAEAYLENVEIDEDNVLAGTVRIVFNEALKMSGSTAEVGDDLFHRFVPTIVIKGEKTVNKIVQRRKVGHTQTEGVGIVELTIEIEEPIGRMLPEKGGSILVDIPEFDSDFVLY